MKAGHNTGDTAHQFCGPFSIPENALRCTEQFLHYKTVFIKRRSCCNRNKILKTATIWDVAPCSIVESYQHFDETWCTHLQVRRASCMGKYGYRYMEIRRGDSPFIFTIATNIRSHTKILRRQDLLSVLNPQPLQSVTASETSSKSSKQAKCMIRLNKQSGTPQWHDSFCCYGTRNSAIF